MRVGVIGLGNVGMGVALSLERAGHSVFGCDLNAQARAQHAAAGAQTVARPDLLPPDLEALVLLVVNSRHAEEALFAPAGVAPSSRLEQSFSTP